MNHKFVPNLTWKSEVELARVKTRILLQSNTSCASCCNFTPANKRFQCSLKNIRVKQYNICALHNTQAIAQIKTVYPKDIIK